MYRSIFLIFALLSGCVPPATQSLALNQPPQRIISTLPSITEVLFDIGVGDRIVGDSSYTKYPPEAAGIDKIGGLHDINREKIISLKPDLIILPEENTAFRSSLPVPVLLVKHSTLSGVLDSYPVIGAVFGEEVLTIAQRRQQELIDKLNEFEAKTKRRKPLRTLICLDRSRGTGRIQNLWIAGTDSFLNEVLVKAGGENVAKFTRQYGTEGIIHLAPDVIIDLYIDGKDSTQSESDWQSLGNSIPAIKNHRILTLTDDFAPVPGTRTPILIEKIVRYFESIEL